jgi:hypothetical protein
MVTVVKCIVLVLILSGAFGACKAEKPVERKKPAPVAVVKPKNAVLTGEQRSALGFAPDVIAQMELAAGADAEPFFGTVLMKTENLKGDQGFESKKLAGFSVRTRNGDELIDSYRASLRSRGYLIFKSQRGYGHLQDIVTIIKGGNSYDVLKMQGTEAPGYQLDTRAIIAWLKARQQEGTFVVTGAGPDWLEARFIKPPKQLLPFAKKIAAFAPDVLAHSPKTMEDLVERMQRNNGFYLVWD